MRFGFVTSLSCAAVLALASTAFAANTPSNAKYEGNCAYGLTMGKAVPTDCSVTWTDPKNSDVYCFSTEEAKAEFAKNIPMNETKANAEFTKITSLRTSETAQKNALDQASDAINQANDAVNQAKTIQGMTH